MTLQLDDILPAVFSGYPAFAWVPQEPSLAIAFWAGAIVIAVSLLMLFLIFLLRINLILRRRREGRFIKQWQPLFAECTLQVPDSFPRIPRSMRYAFLKQWTYHLESLDGTARGNLVKLGKAVGVEKMVRGMILQHDLRHKLIAVVALGHLGDKTRWHELRALVENPSPMLSLAAARALLDIDASATLTWLISVIGSREDWPMAKVVAMLKEIGPNPVTPPLIAAVEAAAAADDCARQVPRLLRLMDVAYPERAAPAVRRILHKTADPEIIAAALRVLHDPQDVGIVRSYAAHENWIVRISAVRSLGRIGMPEDLKLLTDLLGDPHWWVRYHAARALIALPFTTLKELEMISAILPDRFAADMLLQAMAEARAS